MLKIIYDNNAKAPLESSWGFSALLEIDGKRILFDTGWDGDILLRNMERLGIELEFDIICISHIDWDHSGGLPRLLEVMPNPGDVDVFLPIGYSTNQQIYRCHILFLAYFQEPKNKCRFHLDRFHYRGQFPFPDMLSLVYQIPDIHRDKQQ